MPDGGTALAVGGSVLGASNKKKAAKSAAQADIASQEAAIAEQRRQFDETVELLKPFVQNWARGNVWVTAIRRARFVCKWNKQAAIAGLMGPEAQAAQIAQIESDPLFQAQT